MYINNVFDLIKVYFISFVSQSLNDMNRALQKRIDKGLYRGAEPRCPNSVGAARGQKVPLFTRTAVQNTRIYY